FSLQLILIFRIRRGTALATVNVSTTEVS
ncbi:MAG: hypothetical protein QOG47_1989, partial [Mycobacterium sp.]|nr:hypothetical protein [Mycobacterium sp.]